MSVAHTPTPWHSIAGTVKASKIRVGELVAVCSSDANVAGINAAHIVHCVNAHDDLVTALKRVQEDIEEFGTLSPHGRKIVGDALAKEST